MQDFNFDIRDGVLRRYGGYYPEVVIPEGVTCIGKNAFMKCSFLEKVTFPESLTEIGTSAFFSCKNLTSLQLPDNLCIIQNDAFQNCTGLKKITIPEKVTEIRRGVFSYCTNLEEVIFSKNLKNIETGAFFYCKKFKKVNLPDSLEYINEDAFDSEIDRKFYYQGIIFSNFFTNHNGKHIISSNRCIQLIKSHDFFSLDIPFPIDAFLAVQLIQKYPTDKKILNYLEQDVPISAKIYLPNCCDYDMIKTILTYPQIIPKDLTDNLIQRANKEKNYELQVLLTEYKRNSFGLDTVEEKTKKLLLD